MTDDFEERLGHNEALFRRINERIEAGHWPGDDSEQLAFRCECSRLGCNLLVELTLVAYEEVRSSSKWFLLVPGHELPGVEVVVRRGDGYVVVEKVGVAGQVAERTDPRED